MKNEPNFERLRSALFCEEPDRVPLVELQVDQEVKQAFLGKPVEDIKTDVEFWHQAGYDYVPILPLIQLFTNLLPGHTSYTEMAVSEKRYERKWAEQGAGAILSLKDFNACDWPNPENANYRQFDEIKAILPDGMGIVGSGGGLFEFVWQLMGFESFALALVDNPTLVDKMFNRVREIVYAVFTNMMDYECIDAVWFCDDIAYTEGMMISPHILRKYLFPWYKRMAKVCKDRSLPVIYHSDGDLWPVMDDIIDVGINAIHPIEPKGMDISDVKQKVGDRLCVIGNIDLGSTLTMGTPGDVDAEVKQRVMDIGPGGGYCVGSSNTVTNYVPLENYKAMIEATFEYGEYPLA